MADQLILSGVTGIIPTLLGLVGLNKNADNVKHAHQRLNQLEILLRTYPTPTTHHETYSQLLEDVHRIQGYVRKKNRPLHKMFSKPEVHFEQIWIEIEVISTKILEIRREDSALNGMPFSMEQARVDPGVRHSRLFAAKENLLRLGQFFIVSNDYSGRNSSARNTSTQTTPPVVPDTLLRKKSERRRTTNT